MSLDCGRKLGEPRMKPRGHGENRKAPVPQAKGTCEKPHCCFQLVGHQGGTDGSCTSKSWKAFGIITPKDQGLSGLELLLEVLINPAVHILQAVDSAEGTFP